MNQDQYDKIGHWLLGGGLVATYIYLVISGKLQPSGFEFMMGNVIGALLGINMTKQNGGQKDVQNSDSVLPKSVQEPGPKSV